MKIKKLYTLSQFVENCYSEWCADLEELGHNVVNYNQFLNQPLKKEMFVNELEKPDKCNHGYDPQNLLWQEAEKKVIFSEENIETTDICLIMAEYGVIPYGGHTLHDLAEATKGVLKLKNVNL